VLLACILLLLPSHLVVLGVDRRRTFLVASMLGGTGSPQALVPAEIEEAFLRGASTSGKVWSVTGGELLAYDQIQVQPHHLLVCTSKEVILTPRCL
jgi:hypothetical protein